MMQRVFGACRGGPELCLLSAAQLDRLPARQAQLWNGGSLLAMPMSGFGTRYRAEPAGDGQSGSRRTWSGLSVMIANGIRGAK